MDFLRTTAPYSLYLERKQLRYDVFKRFLIVGYNPHTEKCINKSVCMHAQSLSHVGLFVTPWTVAHQALLSMGFLRQEYWSRLSFHSPEAFPDPRIKPMSPALQADSLPLSRLGSPVLGRRFINVFE